MGATDPRVVAAMEFALRAHGRQTRKDGRTPYLVHPVAVLRLLVTRLGIEDPEVLATALLHDVLEDTDATAEEIGSRFGPRVLSWVESLTLPREAHGDGVPFSTKTAFLLRSLEGQPWEAVLVKVCDRWDNLLDMAAAPWSAERRRAFREQTSRWIAAVRERRAADPEPPRLTLPLENGLSALERVLQEPDPYGEGASGSTVR